MSSNADILKVRIKTGEHEFEAEGPLAAVESQVAIFFRLLNRAGIGVEEKDPESSISAEAQTQSGPDIAEAFQVDGKVVSLKSPGPSVDQDLLAILLGQHQLRRMHGIAGTEIMSGLRASGHRINRADHILKRFIRSGDIVVTGKYRSRRYRLTTDGAAKASKAALAAVAAAPPNSNS